MILTKICIYSVFFFFFQSAQFYKVTTEQYQKAADEVSARFKWVPSPVFSWLLDEFLPHYNAQ